MYIVVLSAELIKKKTIINAWAFTVINIAHIFGALSNTDRTVHDKVNQISVGSTNNCAIKPVHIKLKNPTVIVLYNCLCCYTRSSKLNLLLITLSKTTSTVNIAENLSILRKLF